jgi:hypothetical protein
MGSRRIKRRWFVVAGLLIAVGVLTMLVSFAWPLIRDLRKAARQRHLVQQIRSAGGEVSYAHEIDKSTPWPSRTKVRIFGVDYCADVAVVTFPGGTGSDDLMQLLSGLPKLQFLLTENSPITDKGLEYIASLKELKRLSLCGARISDVGIKSLRGLKHLGYLNLNRTAITDAGLESLEGLEGLHFLRLCGTRVTEAGLARLVHLPKLEILHVSIGPNGGLDIRRLEKELPKCLISGEDEKGKLWLPGDGECVGGLKRGHH